MTVDVPGSTLTRVVARFGHMELPNIAPVVRACRTYGIELDRPKAFPAWRREFFVFLRRIARPLPDDLHIEAERRIELGVTVAI